MNWDFFKESGFVGIVLGVLVWVLKWVFKTMEQREKIFNLLQQDWIASMNKHTEQAKDFHNEVKQAHSNQQKEHEAIMDLAGRILDCAVKK